jgi:hypothetical protein
MTRIKLAALIYIARHAAAERALVFSERLH